MVTLYEYRRLNFPRLSEMIVATGMRCVTCPAVPSANQIDSSRCSRMASGIVWWGDLSWGRVNYYSFNG